MFASVKKILGFSIVVLDDILRKLFRWFVRWGFRILSWYGWGIVGSDSSFVAIPFIFLRDLMLIFLGWIGCFFLRLPRRRW